jgi:hypothetical protein
VELTIKIKAVLEGSLIGLTWHMIITAAAVVGVYSLLFTFTRNMDFKTCLILARFPIFLYLRWAIRRALP